VAAGAVATGWCTEKHKLYAVLALLDGVITHVVSRTAR
jgi:hypothetical protein